MAFRFCTKLNAVGLPTCTRDFEHNGPCTHVDSLDHTIIIERLSAMYRHLRGTEPVLHPVRGTRYWRSPLYVMNATNANSGQHMVLYFPWKSTSDNNVRIDAFVREVSEFNDGRFKKLGDEL